MFRSLGRIAMPLALALLLAGSARSVLAAAPEDVAQLKRLQRQLLMSEPASQQERLLERLREWRAHHPHAKSVPAGFRLRLPNGTGSRDLAPTGKFDFFGRASSMARAAVGTPTNVLANDTVGEPDGSCQSEISIASIGDDVVAAWNDGIGTFTPQPNFQGYAWSTDGGITWTDGGAPPTTGIGTWSSDPVLTVNAKTGAFYFSALADNGTITGVAMVKGSFSGASFSWGTPHWAAQYNSSNFCPDKEWIAADSLSGNLYVSFSQFTGSCFAATSDDIAFVRSTDDGVTWSSPMILSSPNDASYVQGSRPAVGPGGEVYVVWHAIGQTFNSAYGRDFLRVRKSSTQGASFQPEVTADSIFSNFGSGAPGFDRGRGITFPGIAVDRSNGPHRGRVYVTWTEAVDFYADNFPKPVLPLPPSKSEQEPNDSETGATAFTPGTILRGTVLTNEDLDYWRWDAVQGHTYGFWVDSLYSALDASFRVFSTTTGTRLAFSQNGQGGQDFIVFTAPTTATYYLRIASYTGSNTGKYRISTMEHVPQADDRARDHRDVFVKYSDDGTTWGSSVRVNDSPGYYDDWFPEVAVDAGGRVFAADYDWRDGLPEWDGGASTAYLYRSDDGGSSWTGGVRIADQTTNWTSVYSTLIPNQGDYIGLFARDSTVFIGWADGRGHQADPNVFIASTKLNCASANISLVGTSVGPDSVIVTWAAVDGTPAELFRRQGVGAWTDIGPVTADVNGRIVYEDTTVVSGQTYSYRLAVNGFCESIVGEVSVVIPTIAGPAVAIYGARPNPTPDTQMNVSFSLASAAPAKLALYDLSGRQVVSLDVGALGPGPHVVNLAQGLTLRSGMYFLRLSQGSRSTSKRVAVFP